MSSMSFDLKISLWYDDMNWYYIKPNKTDLVPNLHGPSLTKASTLSHPCRDSQLEVPELHRRVWTRFYKWIHWDTYEGMIEWVSVVRSPTNNLQRLFLGAHVEMPEWKFAMIRTQHGLHHKDSKTQDKCIYKTTLLESPHCISSFHNNIWMKRTDMCTSYTFPFTCYLGCSLDALAV